ncbi:MAG TPA: ABC transporter substrate-binding protein [Pyrinomonadaceae bacterium]|nr:ABC transporter substrate-binding protein [Pyrinomonadaceae bacterium]
MIYKLKLFAAALAISLCAAAHFGGPAALAARQQSRGAAATPSRVSAAAAPEAARPLTPQERRGRAIYLRGESAAGRAITAVVGEIDVPASTMTCAGCHGLRGEGKTEGGVTAGDLTWSNLTKPYGHTHPSGRKHGAFTDSSVIFSVTNGVDPDRNDLNVAMPRFKMSPEDMADLVAYLKRLEFDRDPGVAADRVEIATIIPTSGALAEMGAAMRDVLAAYFDDLNSRGGIYSRKINLSVVEAGSNDAAARARAAIARGQVFAFVGGLSPGADAELSALAREEEVPFVGPSTLMPQPGTPPNRYVFYLSPGVGEQARSLVNFASESLGMKKPRASVVLAPGALTEAAAAAVEDQAKQAGWGVVGRRAYAPARFDAVALAADLKREGADAVFFFGSGADEATFIKSADATGWTPTIFSLGVLAGGDLPGAVPATFKRKIFLAFPSVPADVTPEGKREFLALLEKYRLPSKHSAAQLAALAAAKTFVEGLKLTGADVSREKLVTSLEGLYEFNTGVTPRLIFGPNRRVGAAGAYMVTINPETKEFAAVGDWVKSY